MVFLVDTTLPSPAYKQNTEHQHKQLNWKAEQTPDTPGVKRSRAISAISAISDRKKNTHMEIEKFGTE